MPGGAPMPRGKVGALAMRWIHRAALPLWSENAKTELLAAGRG